MTKRLLLLPLLTLTLSLEARTLKSDFSDLSSRWRAEQVEGGTVRAMDGMLEITDRGGCTVWFNEELHAPLRITYEARLDPAARVSDLNCFWMASDPRTPTFFSENSVRTGQFGSYDSLSTYYLGIGGNANTTTRFRRYDGTGNRPLLPEHDLAAPEYLLKGDTWYRIELEVTAGGVVRALRDGKKLVEWVDPAPLKHGYFGFRTVDSRIQIRDFTVHDSPPGETAAARVGR